MTVRDSFANASTWTTTRGASPAMEALKWQTTHLRPELFGEMRWNSCYLIYIYICVCVCVLIYLGVSKNRGTPQSGWFIMENPIKNGWFGGEHPLFSETPIYKNGTKFSGMRYKGCVAFMFAMCFTNLGGQAMGRCVAVLCPWNRAWHLWCIARCYQHVIQFYKPTNSTNISGKNPINSAKISRKSHIWKFERKHYLFQNTCWHVR